MADHKPKDHPDHGTSHLKGGQAEKLHEGNEYKSSESGGNMGAGHSGKDDLGSQKGSSGPDYDRNKYHSQH
jgi:hypothetical protein